MNAERRFWQENLDEAQNPENIALCWSRLKEVEQRLIETSRLTLRQRKPILLPDLQMVQNSLPPGSKMVEYVLLGRRIMACVFSPIDPPQWRELEAVEPVSRALNYLRLLMVDFKFIFR